MENAEEVLQSLDEFSKMKPKDIPRELEEYLCFVAKTGDPVYQWPLIKCLFREKLINVITDFYESCPSVDIPPCPNVAAFNYDAMKNFILEKLDTFAAAPFTVQRICELLTTPRKEYNRIDKYMRALEKNILVVSTREPGNRKSTENGENVVNGLESEHVSQEMINSDINVEVEMDESSGWQKSETTVPYAVNETNIILESQSVQASEAVQDTYVSESKASDAAPCGSTISTVITSRPLGYLGYTPNITDLIIEPAPMAAADADTDAVPPPADTDADADAGEPAADNAGMGLFAMGAEPALAADPPEPPKRDGNAEGSDDGERAPYAKPADHVESVFVKADCSESAYVRLEHVDAPPKKDEEALAADGEPETSELRVEAEPSGTPAGQRPASPPADAQQPQTTSTVAEPEPSVVQLEPESTFERAAGTDAEADTEADAAADTPANTDTDTDTAETTITSTDELPAANSADSSAAASEAAAAAEAEPVQTSCDDQVSGSDLAGEEAGGAQRAADAMEVDEAAAPNTTAAHSAMDTN